MNELPSHANNLVLVFEQHNPMSYEVLSHLLQSSRDGRWSLEVGMILTVLNSVLGIRFRIVLKLSENSNWL